ncbi:protein of unknown function [Modicisalibacter ilicicola DSM 19980]|uniref:Protein NO VEIN C-terminal domain-containing protein n=1 Tax=Modicisalibacter ilicicola DSM 19980 TaxID=1121942 RepID=A0A1M4W334_9GAMM|nr:DUF3883 domain-containing protein [Halomonas ilicicola]SHE75681.1 protein of unknown function [Halomonas ilicicola DSM 19980]
MKVVDTKTLAQRLAGGDSYIRTKNGEVQGLAVTVRDNPEAPEVIVVGDGPRIVSNAELLMACERAVPVYIKQAVNAWAFRGFFRATSFSRDPEVIEAYRRHRDAEKVAGILFLEEEYESTDLQAGGRWNIDPETRKAVEEAAIQCVIGYFEGQNPPYKIEDRQKDNCGYDLLVMREDEALRIEVKGTANAEPSFWLSRNEKAGSVHPMWRLAVVTNALSDEERELELFKTAEMEARFDLEPYLWRATVKADT